MQRVTILLLIGISLLCSSAQSAAPKILFVRGGDGTGGATEGKTREQKTENLGDIANDSTRRGNHGWAELASALRDAGFELEQKSEGPDSAPVPLDLTQIDLKQYAVIVFGSNNQRYTDASRQALWTYIRQGGSALFISDSNFGPTPAAAATSDQSLLEGTGVLMNQDHGTYALKRDAGDFLQPDHPILNGVNAMDGEGVSPAQVPERAIEGMKVTALVRSRGKTRLNDDRGTVRESTDRDAALLIIEHGAGRAACHFDRNTFFNQNGAGTNLNRFDNKRYALNLFNWLARRER